jgi:hypothetical protein
MAAGAADLGEEAARELARVLGSGLRTDTTSESLTIPAITVHFTSSSWVESATYGMVSRGVAPGTQNT